VEFFPGELLQNCFQIVTGDDWSVQPFYKVYDSANHNENSVKTNAVFIYVNGSLTEDSIVASLTFLYYLGVGIYCCSFLLTLSLR
jgi:hypothetical protein